MRIEVTTDVAAGTALRYKDFVGRALQVGIHSPIVCSIPEKSTPLCTGLKDGQRVDAADGQLLSDIIVAIIPDATDALVQQSLQSRAERATKVA